MEPHKSEGYYAKCLSIKLEFQMLIIKIKKIMLTDFLYLCMALRTFNDCVKLSSIFAKPNSK